MGNCLTCLDPPANHSQVKCPNCQHTFVPGQPSSAPGTDANQIQLTLQDDADAGAPSKKMPGPSDDGAEGKGGAAPRSWAAAAGGAGGATKQATTNNQARNTNNTNNNNSKPAASSASSSNASFSTGGAAPGSFVQTLFFPDPKLPCRFFLNKQKCHRGANCTYGHEPTSLSQLLDFLASAKKSIDVCIFTLTNDNLADVLITAHNRGVRIRIVTDDECAQQQGSDVQKLADAGVAVRTDAEKTHMHNKFCILDGHFLATGSFNWTIQAVTGNRENVVIMDNPTAVANFSSEFDKLWTIFEKNQLKKSK